MEGAEDERARRSLSIWHQPSVRRATWVIGVCPRCGIAMDLSISGVCGMCYEMSTWATVNRAFCRMLHRPASR